MNTLRDGLPEPPMSMSARPIDERGYPVPWFVAKVGDKWDFRIIAPGKIERAIKFNLCWICGGMLGINKTFILGPMCTVSRVTSEPPSHAHCALYAARVCPFLTLPKAQYRDAGLPQGIRPPAGEFCDRNPGVCALWATKSYTPFDAGNGRLFEVGEPLRVEWMARGRPATRDEVLASIASGVPILKAEAIDRGPEYVDALDKQLELAMRFLPC